MQLKHFGTIWHAIESNWLNWTDLLSNTVVRLMRLAVRFVVGCSYVNQALFAMWVNIACSYVNQALEFAMWVNTPLNRRHIFYDEPACQLANLQLNNIRSFSCILLCALF